MSSALYQIPRNSLMWLLIAQAALIIPHLPRLPVWVVLSWLVTVLWRIQIYRGIWAFPGWMVKLGLVAISVAGLVTEYGRFFGLEPMVGLLITAFLLKLLEMHQKRDALVVIYLGYFVAATEFLFDQTIAVTAYIIFAVVLLTTALIGIYQEQGHRHPWRSFGLAAKLLAQSVPLMLVLFLIIPRVGSLWAVPQQQHGARTGVSDSMSPGDFANLAQDDSTAFRVTFNGPIPPASFLYWRGLVFSEFDGRRWSQSPYQDLRRGTSVEWASANLVPWPEKISNRANRVDYDIIMEASHQLWIYALPTPVVSNEAIGYMRDFRLVHRGPIRNRFRYQASSYLAYSAELDGLSNWELSQELALPEGFNPESNRIARQWRAESDSNEAYIERVLDYIRSDFTYTLQPPLLGRDTVDEFLWQSKRGFCEHFASSFVVMMRAAGIPARVVVGYQGGTVNPIEGFVAVRQSDAHAWAEVWLDNRGWVRVDPTAAVAPDRIELGLSEALSPEDAGLVGGLGSNGGAFSLIARLQLQLEVWEYNWHRWVMGYDQDTQEGVLQRLLGKVSALRVALVLVGIGALALSIIGLHLLWTARGPRRDPGERLYRQFLRRLHGLGVERQRGEGPRSLALRVAQESPPLKAWVMRVSKAYEAYAYAGNPRALRALRLAVSDVPKKTD